MTDLKPAEYDIVTIQNIDSEDFTFEYNRSAGTRPYTIKAGEIARYPRFLADHAVSKLIDQVLTHKKIRTNDKMMRLKYAQKIVLSEEIVLPDVKQSEGELLNKKVEELNKLSELENILANKRAKTTEDNFVLPEDKTLDETPKQEIKYDADHRPYPSRGDLINYAKIEMGMTLDDKTLNKFNAMNIPTLIKELNYPLAQEV